MLENDISPFTDLPFYFLNLSLVELGAQILEGG